MGKPVETHTELRDQILANAIFLFPPTNPDEGTSRFQVVREYSAAHVVYRDASGYRVLVNGLARFNSLSPQYYEMLDALCAKTQTMVKARMLELQAQAVGEGTSIRRLDGVVKPVVRADGKELPPSYSEGK